MPFRQYAIALFSIFLALVMLNACAKEKAAPDKTGQEAGKSVDEFAAEALAKVWQSQYPDASVRSSGNQVLGQNRVIDITVKIEQLEERDKQFICGARYDLTIDEKPAPALTYGAVSLGDSKDSAILQSISNWVLGAGYPLIAACQKSKDAIKLDKWTVYAGPMAIRGLEAEKPGGWVDGSKKMHEKILQAVVNRLDSNTSGFQSLNLLVVNSAEGDLNGEALYNAKPFKAGFNEIAKLKWPKDKEYLFKQSYILVKNESDKPASTKDEPAPDEDKPEAGAEKADTKKSDSKKPAPDEQKPESSSQKQSPTPD